MNKVPQNNSSIRTMTEKNVKKETEKSKIVHIAVQIVIYVFLFSIALIVLFPFYWMIISSLKSLSEYRLSIPTFWPKEVLLSNYKEAFTTANLDDLFYNTLYVGIVSTILSLIITVLSAFSFARLEFKGKDTLFGLLMATMMIPGELFTITNYETVTKLHWTYMSAGEDTWKVFFSYVIPFLVSIFYIYLLRNNFKQIPNELYYAAKVDGAGPIKSFFRITLPLLAPTIFLVLCVNTISTFKVYNELFPLFQGAGIANNLFTVVYYIYYQFRVKSPARYGYAAAAAVILFITVFIFTMIQRWVEAKTKDQEERQWKSL